MSRYDFSSTKSKSLLVASVGFGHPGSEIDHAMVLDTYDQSRDVLIFKNTYDSPESGQPKKVEIERTHPNAPKELYFVHIEIRDMSKLSLPTEESKKRKTRRGEKEEEKYKRMKIENQNNKNHSA